MLTIDKDMWAGTEESYAALVAAEASITNALQAGMRMDMPEGGPKDPFTRAGNVAIIPIKGPLVNSDSPFLSFFGVTGYPAIRGALVAAATDPSITEILLDVDSGGGAVSGCSDTASLISRIGAQLKPVTTFADGTMASAAYWLGCVAGEVYGSSTVLAGSIGVITRHRDYSAQMKQDGVKETVIRAGEFKALGQPSEVLSAKAHEQIQTLLDQVYTVFLTQVSGARGVGYAAADKTFGQGREFIGDAAVQIGLLDGIDTFDAVLSKLQSKKPVDKSQSAYDNGINKKRSLQLPKATLTDKDIAVLAAGGTLSDAAAVVVVAAVAPAVASEAAATLAATPAATEAAAALAETDAAALVAAAEAAKAPAAKEDAGVLAYLEAQIKQKDAQIVQLTLDAKASTDKITGMEASHNGMLEVVKHSVGNMQVALGVEGLDVKALTATEALAQHASLAPRFLSKFKVGGVAAVIPAVDEAAVVKVGSIASAKLAAVRFNKQK